MPSTSAKQKRFMAAAANNAKFAKEAGIDPAVARDFYNADQAKARRASIKRALQTVRRK